MLYKRFEREKLYFESATILKKNFANFLCRLCRDPFNCPTVNAKTNFKTLTKTSRIIAFTIQKQIKYVSNTTSKNLFFDSNFLNNCLEATQFEICKSERIVNLVRVRL